MPPTGTRSLFSAELSSWAHSPFPDFEESVYHRSYNEVALPFPKKMESRYNVYTGVSVRQPNTGSDSK